jgi:Cu(I)/Ag(I) efflux system membrane protein CusA/SilA
VIEGALLRLRPKVMTVSTVVASLLPIMWSTSVGAEVMKPLATPVLGGMVSSLLHVLVITPVLFFWIRERQLGLGSEPVAGQQRGSWPSRRAVATALLALVIVTGAIWWSRSRAVVPHPQRFAERVAKTIPAGELDIVVLASSGALRLGRNAFTIEFRQRGTERLVAVHDLHATAAMPMPGMVMSAGLTLEPTDVPGRYRATAQFDMAGAWRMSLDWLGPAGRGSANFEGVVQ